MFYIGSGTHDRGGHIIVFAGQRKKEGKYGVPHQMWKEGGGVVMVSLLPQQLSKCFSNLLEGVLIDAAGK